MGLAVAAAALWGCGEEVDTATLPVIGGERFEKVVFEDVYRPPNAELAEAETIDLVETETFTVADATPESVLEAYAAALAEDGWEVVEEPQENRDGTWFGSWRRLGRNLVVDASTAEEEGSSLPVDLVVRFQAPQGPDRITGVEPVDLG